MKAYKKISAAELTTILKWFDEGVSGGLIALRIGSNKSHIYRIKNGQRRTKTVKGNGNGNEKHVE